MSPIEPFKTLRSGVVERRWYRFGYIGPTPGCVEEVYPGEPMRLVDLSIRPTTGEERAPGGLYEWCDTVARLTWEPTAMRGAADKLGEARG